MEDSLLLQTQHAPARERPRPSRRLDSLKKTAIRLFSFLMFLYVMHFLHLTRLLQAGIFPHSSDDVFDSPFLSFRPLVSQSKSQEVESATMQLRERMAETQAQLQVQLLQAQMNPNAPGNASSLNFTIQQLTAQRQKLAREEAKEQNDEYLNMTYRNKMTQMKALQALEDGTATKPIPSRINITVKMATFIQRRNLYTKVRQDRYEQALQLMKDEELLKQSDPLNEDNFIEPTESNRVPFVPQVEYLGLLVDAGRHYFSIPWLKRLIKYLYRLRFNLIHFRLTDDQAFNLQLLSYPELALPSAAEPTNATYTPDELRYLVKFAQGYNISIIPEINMPGHAGAWSGIPGMILQCPMFACQTGYGIPMNVEYPELKNVLKSVISEVLDIFDNPPFLHLGGDEVHKSIDCFKELDKEPFEYDKFENQLEDILDEIGYPYEKVIRWEITGPNVAVPHYRAGKIQQNWYNLPGTKLELNPDHTYFNSWGLYMDVNNDDGAAQIFKNTVESFQQHRDGTAHIPMAIIPATFELDVEMWTQRNVAARLLAVSLGAAHLNVMYLETARQLYDDACCDLDLHPTVCDLQGYTAVPLHTYKKTWNVAWEKWKRGSCDQMGGFMLPDDR